ncbi:uncharacterized protein LOC127582904 [Pristis pectinata]|uniref:uncharacterized protein LOC127582904 n=1 Tax=Pristis pectinata TaxID=685728 RepID=UPI00223D73FC|nr:uncharacterized protein LOC127582904 [Pristis pectinata]
MFHEATKKIVKEIDPDGYTLVPATSPYHSQYCKPLHLVKKVKKSFSLETYQYFPQALTLTDILMDGQDLDFGLSSSIFACYTGLFNTSVTGEANVNVCNVDAGVHVSRSASDAVSTMKMRKQIVSEKMLLDVSKARKVNREHSFVKQLKSTIIHFISEVVELDEPCSLTRVSKGAARVKVLLNVQKAAGRLCVTKEKTLSFPAGTTIAYKVHSLMITENGTLELGWNIELLSSDIECYPDPRAELTKLPADKRLLLLNEILEILDNSDDLPVLGGMLDQMCEGLQPDLQVLDLMEESNRVCVEKVLDLLGIKKADPPGQPLTLTQDQEKIIHTVNNIIQSLSEIDPDILILLATSVMAKITSKQLKLVNIINDRWPLGPTCQCELVNVEEEVPEKTVIAQLTDEEFEITQQMLEEFGFQMDRENSSVSRIDDCKQQGILPVSIVLTALSVLSD